MEAAQNREPRAKIADCRLAVSRPGAGATRPLSVTRIFVSAPRWTGSRPACAIALLLTTLGLFAGTLVAEAHAQTETLSGTTTTNSGSVYGCPIRGFFPVSVAANFKAAGSATDGSAYYPATFTNPSANATVAGWYGKPGYMRMTFGIPFVIKSGTTTIAGTITNPYPWAGGLFECGMVYGGAPRATYTATIQPTGQAINGSAEVILNVPVQPGAPGTITEVLSLP
jgi:hypothetical protein